MKGSQITTSYMKKKKRIKKIQMLIPKNQSTETHNYNQLLSWGHNVPKRTNQLLNLLTPYYFLPYGGVLFQLGPQFQAPVFKNHLPPNCRAITKTNKVWNNKNKHTNKQIQIDSKNYLLGTYRLPSASNPSFKNHLPNCRAVTKTRNSLNKKKEDT